MNRLAWTVATLLVLPVAPGAAQEPAQPQPLPHAAADAAVLPGFEQLDSDADRVLTLAEVPEHSALYRDFAHWDANKDGVLNQPEFSRYVDQLAQL